MMPSPEAERSAALVSSVAETRLGLGFEVGEAQDGNDGPVLDATDLTLPQPSRVEQSLVDSLKTTSDLGIAVKMGGVRGTAEGDARIPGDQGHPMLLIDRTSALAGHLTGAS